MKIITAVETYTPNSNDVKVFLGGGITNCRDWQFEVIQKLQGHEKQLQNMVVFNPRRPNFPINDPNASFEQINWEFNYLMMSDIFSMFFCQDTESDQPICMYELGRYIPIKLQQKNKIVITSEPNYKRIKDVEIQSKLALNDNTYQINYDLNQHVDAIIEAYNQINESKTNEKDEGTGTQITESQKFGERDVNMLISESINRTTIFGLNLNSYNNKDNVGLIFENKKFIKCDFRNTTLYNIKYRDCEFVECNFNNSSLHDVVFEDCDIKFTSFINTNGKHFKGCTFLHCEEAENLDMNFSFISKFLDSDKRFIKLEDGVYKIDIPEYSLLNVLIMRNDEISGDPKNPQCDISVYITPVSEEIKQITPLFITYEFDTIANLFKADNFCNNFIADIIQNIKLKYTPIIDSAISQLKSLTGDK